MVQLCCYANMVKLSYYANVVTIMITIIALKGADLLNAPRTVSNTYAKWPGRKSCANHLLRGEETGVPGEDPMTTSFRNKFVIVQTWYSLLCEYGAS